MNKDQTDVSHIDKGEINEPVAYCVDLEEDALIEASKILGLDSTDVNFLNTPLYTHPMRELSDEEIEKIAAKHLSASAEFVGAGEVSYDGEISFARAILKKANEK